MARRRRPIKLPAPYLRRVELLPDRVPDWEYYPFCLPLFRSRSFDLAFDRPITIIVGENGAGKSTLLEGIAMAAGFGLFGGGSAHALGTDREEISLADTLKLGWLPKITEGFFFRAETFFNIATYAERAARDADQMPPDWLLKSHGEGFLDFIAERSERQGIYFFDEPESALSPSRQIDFLRILQRLDKSGVAQVIMATHSPLLMACPGAQLLMLDKYGLVPVELRDTTHFRLLREFCLAPDSFIETMLDG
ncbi:AAA family ATPase [Ancylobacter terrae]|uniref:AAA family ATPase n=1 Tax=Ancylobacter sp. sgz301288 TaxID=3342077 RepID=UPI00385F45A8